MTPPPLPAAPNPSPWRSRALVLTFVAGAVVGAFAAGSEQAGINTTLLVSPVVGAAWGATLADIGANSPTGIPSKKKRAGLAFLGALGLLASLVLFFEVIFPML